MLLLKSVCRQFCALMLHFVSTKVTVAQNLCRMHIIPGQHLMEDMIKTKVFWTLSGHQVTLLSAPVNECYFRTELRF